MFLKLTLRIWKDTFSVGSSGFEGLCLVLNSLKNIHIISWLPVGKCSAIVWDIILPITSVAYAVFKESEWEVASVQNCYPLKPNISFVRIIMWCSVIHIRRTSQFIHCRTKTFIVAFSCVTCLGFFTARNEVWARLYFHRRLILFTGGMPGPGELSGPRGCLVWGVPGGDPPPPDGYCCRRYASYWNAFLLFMKI